MLWSCYTGVRAQQQLRIQNINKRKKYHNFMPQIQFLSGFLLEPWTLGKGCGFSSNPYCLLPVQRKGHCLVTSGTILVQEPLGILPTHPPPKKGHPTTGHPRLLALPSVLGNHDSTAPKGAKKKIRANMTAICCPKEKGTWCIMEACFHILETFWLKTH